MEKNQPLQQFSTGCIYIGIQELKERLEKNQPPQQPRLLHRILKKKRPPKNKSPGDERKLIFLIF